MNNDTATIFVDATKVSCRFGTTEPRSWKLRSFSKHEAIKLARLYAYGCGALHAKVIEDGQQNMIVRLP